MKASLAVAYARLTRMATGFSKIVSPQTATTKTQTSIRLQKNFVTTLTTIATGRQTKAVRKSDVIPTKIAPRRHGVTLLRLHAS
jgi:predicted DNA-binding ribbon-helix-helix protein